MATPTGLYQLDVEQCLIRSDPAQLAAMAHFDTLYQGVTESLSVPWYRRWQRRELPRGLYLWGGVGTGKTLVTLFLSLFLAGVAAGSLLCNRLLKGEVSAKYVPLGALAMMAGPVDARTPAGGTRCTG